MTVCCATCTNVKKSALRQNCLHYAHNIPLFHPRLSCARFAYRQKYIPPTTLPRIFAAASSSQQSFILAAPAVVSSLETPVNVVVGTLLSQLYGKSSKAGQIRGDFSGGRGPNMIANDIDYIHT